MTTTTTKPVTGFKHPFLSAKQAKWLFDLINSRFEVGTPEHDAWKTTYFTVNTRKTFEEAIATLKATPLLVQTPVPAPDAAPEAVVEAPVVIVPTEAPVEAPVALPANAEGLYRNPVTGELYRLTPAPYGWFVSKYSKTSTVRRLTVDGESARVEKGKWTKFNAFVSRVKYLNKSNPIVLAEWAMTEEDKVQYQYGFCAFCYRGLKDERSVRANVGPDCAKRYGLPWGD